MSGVRPSLSRPVGNPSGLKKRTINERQLMEVCNATPPPLLKGGAGELKSANEKSFRFLAGRLLLSVDNEGVLMPSM